jgi:hypothetical protein
MNEVTVRAVNPPILSNPIQSIGEPFTLPLPLLSPHSFGLGPYLFRRNQAVFSFSVDRIPLSFTCCPGDFCSVVLLLSS